MDHGEAQANTKETALRHLRGSPKKDETMRKETFDAEQMNRVIAEIKDLNTRLGLAQGLLKSREAEMVTLIKLLQGWIVWWDCDNQMNADPPDQATRDLFTSNSE